MGGETLLQSTAVAESVRALLPNALTHPVALGLLVAGGLGLVYYGFTVHKLSSLVRNTPTETVRSAAAGRTELEGRVRPADETFSAPLSDGDCVYAAWTVEEYDHSNEGWETVGRGSEAVDFYAEDDTSRLLVGAEGAGADFEIADEHSRTLSVPGDEETPPAVESFLASGRSGEMDVGAAETYGVLDVVKLLTNPTGGLTGQAGPADTMTMGQDTGLGTTDAPRRYRQRVLPVDEPVYVYGGTRPPHEQEQGDGDSLVLTADPATGEFIVSNMGEAGIAKHYSRRGPLWIILGGLVSTVGVYLLAALYLI
jgi:hypothetical protein